MSTTRTDSHETVGGPRGGVGIKNDTTYEILDLLWGRKQGKRNAKNVCAVRKFESGFPSDPKPEWEDGAPA